LYKEISLADNVPSFPVEIQNKNISLVFGDFQLKTDAFLAISWKSLLVGIYTALTIRPI